MSRRSVEEWRRAVYGASKVNDATKLMLLFLADHMRADRKVSVPQTAIAEALGKSESRVKERVRWARKAGWLSRVSGGYRGHTAVYQGTFPSSESGSSTSTQMGAELRTLSKRERVLEDDPPVLKRASPQRVTDRDVGNDEEAEAQPVRSDLTPCEWHQWEACPPDCANHPHTREESA